MVRVNHAGERAAVMMHAGQTLMISGRKSRLDEIKVND